MDKKPETKLMCAIFGDYLQNSDLHEAVEGQTLREALYQSLDRLIQSKADAPAFKQRIRKIIDLHFGFEGERSHTLEEISKEFNRTRECIRANEAKALRMLRHPANTKKLKPFIKEMADE